MPTKIEISYKTIIFAVLFLIALWLLLEIKDILFLVFVSFILMSALRPLVEGLIRRRIPKTLSVIIVYLLFIAVIGFIGSAIVPPLVTQSAHLSESLPEYLSTVVPFVKVDQQTIVGQIAPIGQNLLKVTLGLFGDVVTLVTIFVISFYLIIERKNLDIHLSGLTGEIAARRLLIVIRKIEERLGAWVRGEMALMITIGLFTFIGLTILGLPYVLPLAIIAGILEIVPTIGPIISAIPAVIIALTVSPVYALITVVVYFVIQQLENQLVVPFVMKKVVGVPPLVTLLSLLIGGKLAGITGAILAIPIVVTIETIISEYLRQPQGN
ncbi:AI-2E family transporter [Candidatus Microgenomates bacterium]|nr:AI-2E family transporter [Candidatus Microgenomates bacterium]